MKIFKFINIAFIAMLIPFLVACEMAPGINGVGSDQEDDSLLSTEISDESNGDNRAAASSWQQVTTPNSSPFVVRITDVANEGFDETGEVVGGSYKEDSPVDGDNVPTFTLSRDGAANNSPVLTVREGQWFRVKTTKPLMNSWPPFGWTIYAIHDTRSPILSGKLFSKYKKGMNNPIWGSCGGNAVTETITETTTVTWNDGETYPSKIKKFVSCLYYADNTLSVEEDRTLSFQSLDRTRETEPASALDNLRFKIIGSGEGNSRQYGVTSTSDSMIAGQVVKVEAWNSNSGTSGDFTPTSYVVKVYRSRKTIGENWRNIETLSFKQTGWSGSVATLVTYIVQENEPPKEDKYIYGCPIENGSICQYQFPERRLHYNVDDSRDRSPRVERLKFVLESPDYQDTNGNDVEPNIIIQLRDPAHAEVEFFPPEPDVNDPISLKVMKTNSSSDPLEFTITIEGEPYSRDYFIKVTSASYIEAGGFYDRVGNMRFKTVGSNTPGGSTSSYIAVVPTNDSSGCDGSRTSDGACTFNVRDHVAKIRAIIWYPEEYRGKPAVIWPEPPEEEE